jgi:glycosyltransferase involved in cell wall biosynthesis
MWRPAVAARVIGDVLRTSGGLLLDAWRQRATAILVPDHTAVMRNLPALLLLRVAGVRIVHRLGTAPEDGAGYRRLWRWCIAPVSHTLVCNSAFTARELAACGVPAAKIAVAPNVLPVDRRRAGLPHPMPGRIVYAGQIIPGKGVHLLIDAVALLVGRGHEVSLDIAGNMGGWESPTWAGYQADLRAKARHRALRGRVRFLGWQSDVPALMAAAWLHAAPSLPEIREGFGIVVLEAKSGGVPSIVGASGALPDLIAHGVDGWVVREPTAEAIAEGITMFLGGEARAHASAAARSSLTRSSPAAFAAAWDAAFEWTGALDCPVESGSCP